MTSLFEALEGLGSDPSPSYFCPTYLDNLIPITPRTQFSLARAKLAPELKRFHKEKIGLTGQQLRKRTLAEKRKLGTFVLVCLTLMIMKYWTPQNIRIFYIRYTRGKRMMISLRNRA